MAKIISRGWLKPDDPRISDEWRFVSEGVHINAPKKPSESTPSASGTSVQLELADPGLAVVDYIYSRHKIDPEWSIRQERGFTWWGKDFAQRIWAEPVFDDDGFFISRVHACTDIVTGFSASEKNLVTLALLNGMASLSGFVWEPSEPGKVRLAASMYVHEETLQMVQLLFSIAAAIQAADAQIKASGLAEIFGAKPDSSSHPTSGPRPACDDMLNVLDQLVIPRGKGESLWAGKEMEQALEFLKQPPCVGCTGDKNGLAAEFPLIDRTSLLTMDTRQEHPQLGKGLLILLRLPFLTSKEEAARWAVNLNSRELGELTRLPFLGSWCSQKEEFCFVSFYPNFCFAPGLLLNLVMDMISRALWVAEEVMVTRLSVGRWAPIRPGIEFWQSTGK
jgi:hypothetical protein